MPLSLAAPGLPDSFDEASRPGRTACKTGVPCLFLLALLALLAPAPARSQGTPSCLGLRNERLTCATNVPGKLNYSFDLQNNTGVPVKYLFLVPATNCFTIMPGIVTFQPPLPPGQTASVSAMISVSADCPTNLCFFVAAHDSNLVNCCSIMHCVNRPDCSDCATPAHLSIVWDNGSIVISWTGSGHLQCATTVTGPWVDVPGATNPYPVSAAAGGAHKFYRVVCP